MPRSPIIKLSKKPLRFPKKFVRRAVGTIKNHRVPVLPGHPTYSSRNHKGKGAYSGAARPPVKDPVMVGQRTGDAQTTFKPKPSRIGMRAVPKCGPWYQLRGRKGIWEQERYRFFGSYEEGGGHHLGFSIAG
ncbi:hypothetical protein HPP92_024893 [Vanilla planifolia]|uniref:Uncharacterized protein n=1 Tax=Vanilla planifolia TaxID=51239 RepID=A0A835PI27_VANPL|nr:hypothetical protein HPP92_024893 [Vanilla planifolia]